MSESIVRAFEMYQEIDRWG